MGLGTGSQRWMGQSRQGRRGHSAAGHKGQQQGQAHNEAHYRKQSHFHRFAPFVCVADERQSTRLLFSGISRPFHLLAQIPVALHQFRPLQRLGELCEPMRDVGLI